jgi:hypothetical protein
MATRRMISKSISVSDKTNDLSDFAALLFTWMIPHTDDYGIIHGTPGKIKAMVIPRRKQTEKQVADALNEMQKVGLIWRYIYKNEHYIQFCRFEDHQAGLHKRTEPKHPPLSDCCNDTDNFREVPGNSPSRARGIEPKGTEKKGIEENSPPAYDYFSDFWKEYPRKDAKQDAIKAFAKMKMDDLLMKRIMESLYRATESEAWKKDVGKFIPHAATWLNGRRWEDGV